MSDPAPVPAPAPAPAAPAGDPLVKLAVDFGPLVVFFLVNALYDAPLAIARIVAATGAFMAATVVAMLVSRWRLGHVSPMLWISGGFVLVFGGFTMWFHDATFIKMKPTIVYALFAAILGFGLATGRPLLRQLLESAYPGLTPAGWRKLTVNWTLFFIGMAALNELVWRITAPGAQDDMSFWVGFKLWGAIPLTLLFAFANIPMLLRHGLTTDPAKAAADTLPPEG